MEFKHIEPTRVGMEYHLKGAIPRAALVNSRESLARSVRGTLPENRGPIIAEIGVANGKFSRVLREVFLPRTFYLIDTHLISLFGAAPDIVYLPGDSSARLSGLADNTLDYAYVDGDHTFEGVCKDIEQLHRKVRVGGVIQFNDYTTYSPAEKTEYGVLAAVNAYIEQHGAEIVGLSLDRSGYHDIAVRVAK